MIIGGAEFDRKGLQVNMTVEMMQKIEDVVAAALQKIGADGIQKKVALAVKFARSQPPVQITLDGHSVVGVAVDIATVFSLEGNYRQTEYNGKAITVETVRALGIVLVEDDVKLCKSTYDVVPGPAFQDAKFINARYRTTSLDELTEEYIC